MIYLLAIIVLQWIYIIYKEETVRKERADLQLKLMSKSVTEYKEVTEPPQENTHVEEDPYKDIDEVPINKLLKANDNI